MSGQNAESFPHRLSFVTHSERAEGAALTKGADPAEGGAPEEEGAPEENADPAEWAAPAKATAFKKTVAITRRFCDSPMFDMMVLRLCEKTAA